jgi:ADP-ribose pyrophosphatase YjhB (NUDIX family)
MNDQTAYRIRVSAAIRRAPGEILLVRERVRGERHLKMPGGTPRIGETLDKAVVREVAEEPGLEIVPGEIAYITERHDRRWDDIKLDICFYASVSGSSTVARDPEVIEPVWLFLQDPEAIAHVPHLPSLENSSRGRYIVSVATPHR